MHDQLDGFAEPAFARLRDTFARSFGVQGHMGEHGAALCVFRHGRPVLDLWGGHADAARTRRFERGTLALMMSVAKGILSLAVHMLADRGKLSLDWPVARVWPAFAAHGKEAVLIGHVLDHRAGVPALDSATLPVNYYDHAAVAAALERTAPIWPPGKTACYHSITMGYLLGEVVRQVDGRSVGQFLREEVAGPLGAEYLIGLLPEEAARWAEWVADAAPEPPAGSLEARIDGGLSSQADADLPGFLAAEIPSVNGCGQVRGVARIYAALAAGGTLDGVRLLDSDTLARAVRPRWAGLLEQLSGRTDIRMAAGFMLASPASGMRLGSRAFGHPGTGGAIGFADPENGVAFAYAPCAPYPTEQLGERTPRLVDALYACLEA